MLRVLPFPTVWKQQEFKCVSNSEEARTRQLSQLPRRNPSQQPLVEERLMSFFMHSKNGVISCRILEKYIANQKLASVYSRQTFMLELIY